MVAVFMTTHSMSTASIVAAQAHFWYAIPLLPSFVIGGR
jgi:NADH:ubiquinone oxidoreductase subunit H